MPEARGTGRLLARLDNIEEFEDDRMRFEARFELGHHRHESVHRRRRAPRPELAPDRVAIGHEAVLVGLASRMDDAIIRPQEAVNSEESRAGKECVSTCRSRWSTKH